MSGGGPAAEAAANAATVEAPANIAFVKYWGARDLERAIPVNASISMTLRRCLSRTCVRVLGAGAPDRVLIAGEAGVRPAPAAFAARVCAHLARLRAWAERECGFEVVTRNSFPAGAGMASSASGFAALTLATVAALGRQIDGSEASRLARLSGSGSAARSVFGGYVQWPGGGDPEACVAEQIAPAEHWDLRDVVALVQSAPKAVASLEGHVRAPTSPHFERRQQLLADRLERVRRAIRERSLQLLGPVLEEDAIELHLIAMSSRPPIFYWRPATLRVLEAVRALRDRGVGAWMTMDAGANVHVICAPEDEPEVAEVLARTEGVVGIVRDGVGPGPRRVDVPVGAPFEEGEAMTGGSGR